ASVASGRGKRRAGQRAGQDGETSERSIETPSMVSAWNPAPEGDLARNIKPVTEILKVRPNRTVRLSRHASHADVTVTQPFVRLAGAAVTQPSGLVRARTDDWRAR